MINKNLLSKVFRWTSIGVFVLGAFIGWDAGEKMVIISTEVKYTFDLITAFLYWFGAFSIGMIFIGIAKMIDLLNEIAGKI